MRAAMEATGGCHRRRRPAHRRCIARPTPASASISATSSITAPAPRCRVLISLDDADRHQRVANHIRAMPKPTTDKPWRPGPASTDRVCPARTLAPRRKVGLVGVTAHHHPAAHRRSGPGTSSSARGVVFCASSRMMKASLSVRPRMKAIGATSIDRRAQCAVRPARPRACRRGRRRAGAGTGQPSPACRRAGNPATPRPRPPGARISRVDAAGYQLRAPPAHTPRIGLARAGRPEREDQGHRAPGDSMERVWVVERGTMAFLRVRIMTARQGGHFVGDDPVQRQAGWRC